ncbi:response regulator receiver protein [Formosa agariphila KMM 3901]|uniref:Response regulator receiver protein n=1 Tax=Formosa agariphila (strain DSM 15362 / KCTC 12365 / LMG 23005 / KMM 3901 / M-2Alg 35-1) TaxID=1347342 RepID=T2KPC9_FORAG|nr:response regulator [Formosa agariphila]CDF80323.1 response regulator receiver protein [Formosa agariphila KMM 3901]
MKNTALHVLIADDDIDDREFFEDALESIPIPTTLQTVNDGVALLNYLLEDEKHYPDVLFLDLNMPKKSGRDCLAEIKNNDILSHIPVIIYSTSLDKDVAHTLYELGANYYIQKPGDFSQLKKVIHKALTLFNTNQFKPSCPEQFIIQT